MLEKNRLIERQTALINQQIDALADLEMVRGELEDYRLKSVDRENRIRILEKQNRALSVFKDRVLNHWFIRLMHWFRDE